MKTFASALSRVRRGRVWPKLLIFFVAAVAAFALAWMLLLPSLVTGLIEKRTGFPATVESLHANPFIASINIRRLAIYNPDSFPLKDFIQVNQFKTSVPLGSIFSDRVIINDAVFDVAVIAVVKNARGQTNVDLFKSGVLGTEAADQPGAAKSAPPESSEPAKQFLIHRLVVRLGKIIVIDYSGGKASVHEIPLNINRTFTEVSDLKQISVPLISDLGAAVGQEAGDVLSLVIPAPILQRLGIVAKDTTGVLHKTGQKTTRFLKGLIDSLEEKPKP